MPRLCKCFLHLILVLWSYCLAAAAAAWSHHTTVLQLHAACTSAYIAHAGCAAAAVLLLQDLQPLVVWLLLLLRLA
jgi:hypothetical protein